MGHPRHRTTNVRHRNTVSARKKAAPIFFCGNVARDQVACPGNPPGETLNGDEVGLELITPWHSRDQVTSIEGSSLGASMIHNEKEVRPCGGSVARGHRNRGTGRAGHAGGSRSTPASEPGR